MLFHRERTGYPPKLTAVHFDEVMAMIDAGEKLNTIAERMGVGSSALHRYLRLYGIRLRTRRYSEAELDRAEELRRAGRTWGEIGRHLGLHGPSIQIGLRRRGREQ